MQLCLISVGVSGGVLSAGVRGGAVRGKGAAVLV